MLLCACLSSKQWGHALTLMKFHFTNFQYRCIGVCTYDYCQSRYIYPLETLAATFSNGKSTHELCRQISQLGLLASGKPLQVNVLFHFRWHYIEYVNTICENQDTGPSGNFELSPYIFQSFVVWISRSLTLRFQLKLSLRLCWRGVHTLAWGCWSLPSCILDFCTLVLQQLGEWSFFHSLEVAGWESWSESSGGAPDLAMAGGYFAQVSRLYSFNHATRALSSHASISFTRCSMALLVWAIYSFSNSMHVFLNSCIKFHWRMRLVSRLPNLTFQPISASVGAARFLYSVKQVRVHVDN